MDHIDRYREFASYLYESKKEYFFSQTLTSEEETHIIDIATSVMLHRDSIRPGGGFVQAICNNDLKGAFDRADSTIVKSIRFMVNTYWNAHIRDFDPRFESVPLD